MSAKKAAKHGLGRGFSSLIPTELLDESFDPTATEDERVSELRHIKVEQITPDPEQPRQQFQPAALDELAQSIREHGIIQPLIVTPRQGQYVIVAGERRFRAAQIAGLDKVPALVRTLGAQHQLELSLIENLQRRDLNPLETATAYLKLRDQFNMTLEMIAKRMGIASVSTVSNRMRLLKLPKAVQAALVEGEITEGQARPLIGLDEAIIREVLPKMVAEQWSARKVEQFIVQLKQEGTTARPAGPPPRDVHIHDQRIQHLSQRLAAPVTISSNSKGAGKITISFKDEAELQRLEELLAK